MSSKVFLLIVTGPVGVGKSKVSEAAADILCLKQIPNAVIDVDCFRHAYPVSPDDRFNTSLVYKNLAAVWPNYVKLGISHIIIPNVIETREEIEKYKSAIPDADITVIRLDANIDILHKRLENRETGDMLKWHKNRAVELKKQFDIRKLESIVIKTDNKSIEEAAVDVISAWLKNLS
jgi:adenylylsulfate kinase-like enzyme